MCCEQLVCAACGGRVSDARCATCIASRESVHAAPSALRPELMVLLVLLVLLVGLVAR